MKWHVGVRSGLVVLASAVVVLGVTACSSSSKRPEMAALTKVQPTLLAQPVWQAPVGEPAPLLVPVLLGREWVLATAAGQLLALDTETGKPRWQVDVHAPLAVGVGYDGQTAAAITQNNELVAVAQGQVQWRVRLETRVFTAPLVAGRRVFVLQGDRSVTAYDAGNGALLWTQPARGTEPLVLQQPGVLLAVGDTLAVGMGGRLLGLNPNNGSKRWDVPVASPRGVNEIERLVDLVAPAARVQRDVCVRAFQAALACVDGQRGTLRWTKNANGAVGVAADSGLVYGTESQGRFMAWKIDSGEVQWQSDLLLHRGLTAPLAAGRAVAVGDAQGYVHLLDRDNGQLLNRLETDGSAIVSAPVLAGDKLLALTRKGVVHAWRPQ